MKRILVYCFCSFLLAQQAKAWWSDTCITNSSSTQPLYDFIAPANPILPDYEPSSRWDVGIAVLNGPFKALKSYFKYLGRNELTALMGGFNAFGDFVLLCVKEGASPKEGAVFAARLTRELLRASNGPGLRTTGSYADLTQLSTQFDFANMVKGLLKIPLLIEKNLDWGDDSTSTGAWLMGSMPGILLSLTEHYARYYRQYALRPKVGFALVGLEIASFYSMCAQPNKSSEESYKNVRQVARTMLHLIQYVYLFRDHKSDKKFRMFTYFTMLEHLLVSAADWVYYSWYLQSNLISGQNASIRKNNEHD